MTRVGPPPPRRGDTSFDQEQRGLAVIERVTDRLAELRTAILINMTGIEATEIINTMWEETRGEDQEDLLHGLFTLVNKEATVRAEKRVYEFRHAWFPHQMISSEID